MTAPVEAPPALCMSFIGARIGRVTLTDACGRPMWGPETQWVFEGFVGIEIAPQVTEGQEQKVVTAGGKVCVNERAQDTVSWQNITVDFCNVDPSLFLAMQRTWKRVTEASRRTTTGWRQGETISDQLGYALELWPKAAGRGASQACLLGDVTVSDPTFMPGGYILVPWILGLAPEPMTFDQNPTSFKQKGRTRAGSLWGRGPYKVTRDLDGQPARLLDPIDPGFDVPQWNFKSTGDPDHVHVELVTVAPPEPTCGPQPLWNPDATTPTITTVATPGNTMSVDLTVTNFDVVGKSGVVHWGDGQSSALPFSSNGKASHAYAASAAGKEQTISFLAGNGAAPVTAKFTPAGTAPTAPTVTTAATPGNPMSADLTITNFDVIGKTATVQWGDGQSSQLAADSGKASHVYASAAAGTEQTITVTAANGSTPATAKFTPTAPVAPTVTATATDGNPMSVDFTVTNFAAIGRSGTVQWGDGQTSPMPASTNGQLSHAYATATAGTEQTITFTAANGAAPVTAKFTPTAPPTARTARA